MPFKKSHIGSLCNDGFYGQNELIPIASQSQVDAESRKKAIKHVASMANDAEDCAMILDMLGLNPLEVYE